MIRIRNNAGKITYENKDDSFIELCTSDNKLVAVFYERQDNGEITQLMGDCPEAKKYEELFKTKFVKRRIHLKDE